MEKCIPRSLWLFFVWLNEGGSFWLIPQPATRGRWHVTNCTSGIVYTSCLLSGAVDIFNRQTDGLLLAHDKTIQHWIQCKFNVCAYFAARFYLLSQCAPSRPPEMEGGKTHVIQTQERTVKCGVSFLNRLRFWLLTFGKMLCRPSLDIVNGWNQWQNFACFELTAINLDVVHEVNVRHL